jgi:hypothetical protein
MFNAAISAPLLSIMTLPNCYPHGCKGGRESDTATQATDKAQAFRQNRLQTDTQHRQHRETHQHRGGCKVSLTLNKPNNNALTIALALTLTQYSTAQHSTQRCHKAISEDDPRRVSRVVYPETKTCTLRCKETRSGSFVIDHFPCRDQQ